MEKLQLLESVLGTSVKANRDYYQFHCPFCNHHKKKLGISIRTGIWKCWVCPAKGSKVGGLFQKLRQDSAIISKAKELWNERLYSQKNEPVLLHLPTDFKPLNVETGSFFYRKAKNYLLGRGVTEQDIIKHRLGYCERGQYSDMVVFPYFSETGTLTHFAGRTFLDKQFKFKEPDNSDKNIVADENLINWQEPIILVESKLDAIVVRRNAVPLNGKKLTEKLRKKILQEGTSHIIFCLDGDALNDAMMQAEYFINNGIGVSCVTLPRNEDPNSLGYSKVWQFIHDAKIITNTDIFKFKILTKLK
jgi:DNA primase